MPQQTTRIEPQRVVSLRADTLNEEARTVEAVLATENPTAVMDNERLEVIDEILLMSGAEPIEHMSLLAVHQRESLEDLIGSVTNVRTVKEDSNIGPHQVGLLQFAKSDDPSSPEEKAFTKLKQGHLRQVSVAVRAIESTRIEPGDSATIGERSFKAGKRPMQVNTRWIAREASVVPVGADAAATVRSFETYKKTTGASEMDLKLRAYLETTGLAKNVTDTDAWAYFVQLSGDERQRADTLLTGVVPDSSGQPKVDTPKTAVDLETTRADAVLEERTRTSAILNLRRDDTPTVLIDKAISESWTVEKAAVAILEHERSATQPPVSQQAPAGIVYGDEKLNTRSALQAGLMWRTGDIDWWVKQPAVDPAIPSGEEKRRGEAYELGYRHRDMSLFDLCRESLRLADVSVPHTRDETIRAAMSTGELSNIFTTSVNARIIRSYLEAADSSSTWTNETDVADFKTNERTRLGKTAALERLSRGGTAKHATRADVKEEYRVYRFAKQVVIAEEDFIDDRMNALTSYPAELGAAARRLRPDIVYGILLANGTMSDGTALFAAGHSNNATSALGEVALQDAVVAMSKQTEDGVTLNLSPSWLLTPQDLRFTAKRILRSSETRSKGDTDSTFVGTMNAIQGEGIEHISDNRIGVAGVTDPISSTAYAGSATTWFLIGDKSRGPTIEVAYLQGTNRRPSVRRFVLSQGQWGIGWDINQDIGAKAIDFRNMYKGNA